MASLFKKTGVNLELSTDVDMLLMIETGTRGGICQSTLRYVKANNQYIENYDKKIESSYLTYLDVDNLYGWAMSKNYLQMVLNGKMIYQDLMKTL